MNIKVSNLKNYFKKFFGVRIIKTALATTLSLWIASLLDLQMPSMVALSAITTMTSSIFESYKDSINRFLSTIVGVLVGCFFHFIGFTNLFATGLAMIIVINICNYFNWKDATKLSLMIVVMVMIHSPQPPEYLNFWEYSINRLLDTSIGLVVGFLVNYFILPPDRMRYILNSYKKTLSDIEKALMAFLKGQVVEIDFIINDINDLSHEVDYAKKEYLLDDNSNIKTSQLARINSLFYSAFAILTQFVEDEQIPKLSKDNVNNLENYFNLNFEIDFTSVDDEFELAFNYYFDDLIYKLEEIRNEINKLEAQASKDEEMS